MVSAPTLMMRRSTACPQRTWQAAERGQAPVTLLLFPVFTPEIGFSAAKSRSASLYTPGTVENSRGFDTLELCGGFFDGLSSDAYDAPELFLCGIYAFICCLSRANERVVS